MKTNLFRFTAPVLLACALVGGAQAAFIQVGSPSENRIQVDQRWTRDNVYILSRTVFIDNGATLTIEPGTLIRGVTTNLSQVPSEPGTLVVARGGKLVANGTPDDPIIFTTIDDPNVPGVNTIPSVFNPLAATISVTQEAFRRATAAGSNDRITVRVAAQNVAPGATVRFGNVAAGLVSGTDYTVLDQPTTTTFRIDDGFGGPRDLTGTSTSNVTITHVNAVPLDESVNQNQIVTPFALVNNTEYFISGSPIPGGFTALTDYYVINQVTFAGAFISQLSATVGGAAIDITGNGASVQLSPPAGSIPVTGPGRDASLAFNNYSMVQGLEADNGMSKSAGWGGIIICGRAYVGQSTVAAGLTNDGNGRHSINPIIDATGQNNGQGTDYVEGLSTASGSTVLNSTLAIYGGLDDSDNSGVMRFCSLRYGGFVVGAAATGNEINGLTICGAGTGTVLEHIEVFQNRDDGFEWFGGKHDSRFLFSISNQDDSFDADEGYRGNGQGWLAVQGSISQSSDADSPTTSGFANANSASAEYYIQQEETAGDYQYDELMEIDGAETNDQDRLPRTNMVVFNATLLAGHTAKRGIEPDDQTLLGVHDSVVEGANGFNKQITTLEGTLATQLTISNIHTNNYFGNGFNAAATGNLVQNAPTTVEETTSMIASNWNNDILGTALLTSDLYTLNGFDPRTTGATALTDDGSFVPPAGFVDPGFAGAMKDNTQLSGWSVLEYLEVLTATNVARPILTIGVTGSNPTITFPSAGAGVKYVVERSTNGKVWVPVNTVPVSDPTTISVTDSSTTVGAPVLYRAYAL